MKHTYRLPHGGTTTNVRRMASEWKAISDPLNRLFSPVGYRVSGFDPGFLVISERGDRRPSLDLTVEVAEHLTKYEHRDVQELLRLLDEVEQTGKDMPEHGQIAVDKDKFQNLIDWAVNYLGDD